MIGFQTKSPVFYDIQFGNLRIRYLLISLHWNGWKNDHFHRPLKSTVIFATQTVAFYNRAWACLSKHHALDLRTNKVHQLWLTLLKASSLLSLSQALSIFISVTNFFVLCKLKTQLSIYGVDVNAYPDRFLYTFYMLAMDMWTTNWWLSSHVEKDDNSKIISMLLGQCILPFRDVGDQI